MTTTEANRIIWDYNTSNHHTDVDKFLYVEAWHFLIDTYHKPTDMHNLGCHYLEERRFDLYMKYTEMAAEYGYYPAYECLGYIWYYGQTGTVDYKKAFEYFSKGAECPDDLMRVNCEYKIADMYHNGYYVDKDEGKYREIIERLYDTLQHPERLNSDFESEFFPHPDVYHRLAGIRIDEGRFDEAESLLREARVQYAEYLRNNPYWWGHVEDMERVVTMMHSLPTAKNTITDIFDLFWIAKEECKVAFEYKGRRFVIECFMEDGPVVRFDYKWYSDIRKFLENAKIDDHHLTTLYDELHDFEVCYG